MLSYFGRTSIFCIFTLHECFTKRQKNLPKNASVISGVLALQTGRLVCSTALLMKQWVVSPLSSLIFCSEWSFFLPQSCHALCLHQQGLPLAGAGFYAVPLLMLYTIILHFPSSCCPRGKVGLGSKSLEMWQGHRARLNLQVIPWRWELCHQHPTLMSFWSCPDLILPHPSCCRWAEWAASPPLWI